MDGRSSFSINKSNKQRLLFLEVVCFVIWKKKRKLKWFSYLTNNGKSSPPMKAQCKIKVKILWIQFWLQWCRCIGYLSLLSIERQSRILCGVSSKIWSFCHAHSQSLQLGALKFSPRNIFINSLILKHTQEKTRVLSFFPVHQKSLERITLTMFNVWLPLAACYNSTNRMNRKKDTMISIKWPARIIQPSKHLVLSKILALHTTPSVLSTGRSKLGIVFQTLLS